MFYVTGHLYPELGNREDYPYKGPRILFRNDGSGKFTLITNECGPGLSAVHSSRGCAFGDFDNDGDMDVLIMNMNEPPSLLRTDVTTKNHWVKVKLRGKQSNRTAIGARVRVRAGGRVQAQHVESQSSYYSVNDLRLHFGLGASRRVDSIEISWPSGKRETVRDVEADRLVYIEEGAGVVKSVKF